MKLRPLIAAAVLSVGLVGPARASVTVVGDTSAAGCSEAAVNRRADDDSMQLCNQAIDDGALNRRNLTATYINRGDILMNRREYAAARADFERAIQLDPSVGEPWMDRGAINIIEHRFQEGIADTTKGLALGLEDPAKAYFNRAVAYEGIDDEKSAYFDYQQALVLKPDWAAPKRELMRFTVTRRTAPAPNGAPSPTAAPG
jgi:tetratricopeptide (TPR) repeat protein